MKVAIDVSPLKTAHRFRGIGVYAQNLTEALKKHSDANFQVELVEKGKISGDTDLIHYPYFDLFWMTLPLIKKKKTVVTVHDVIPLIFPDEYPPGIKGKVKFQIQKLSLRGVRAVICDSESSKKDIFSYLNYPKEKTFVVYLAPSDKFRPLEPKTQNLKLIIRKYSLPNRFVLYVGDVNYNKNVLGLVKACKNIKSPLVIVGKQAAQGEFDQAHIENQPLVQLIKQYGKDPQVLRLGYVPDEDLVGLYNLATVYCQPSFYEGFGLPVLEAMASGTPVVTSNQSSLPEIVGRAVVMIDPYDTNDLANGLTVAIEDEDLREDLIQRGLNQVKKFSWEKTAGETYQVYREVVQKK